MARTSTESATRSSFTAPPLTFQVDSQLIEDYLHTQNILVDASQPQPLTVITNPNGQTEALSIDETGDLRYVCREPLSDSGWNMYSMGAGFRALVNAGSGVLLGVGNDFPGSFWRYEAGRWQAIPVDLPLLPSNGMPTDLSITQDGQILVVTDAPPYILYMNQPPHKQWNWQFWMSTALGQAPVGNSSDLWAIDFNWNVCRSKAQSDWQGVAALPNGDMPRQLAVGADQSVWVVSQTQVLYRYVNEQWQPASQAPSLSYVAVVDANNIWGIDTTQTIQQCINGTWKAVPCPAPLDANPSRLSAAADGTVICLDGNGVPWRFMSASGAWQRILRPTGMKGPLSGTQITEVVAGKDEHGTPHAFYVENTVNGSGTRHAYYSEGGWHSDGFSYPCSRIGLTNQQDTGQLIAYGVSHNGNLVVATSSGGQFSANEFAANALLNGVKLNISALNASAWFTSAVIGGCVCVVWGDATNPFSGTPVSGTPNVVWPVQIMGTNNIPSNLKEIIRLPWVQNERNCYAAAVDQDGNVWMLFDISFAPVNYYGPGGAYGYYVQLSGGSPPASVTCVSALIDTQNMARFYATDTGNKLWVIRQTGIIDQASNPFTWTSWHPLGDNCTCLANGPGLVACPDLFALDENQFLTQLSQNPISGDWRALPVRKPGSATDDPDYIAQYVTDVTLVNQNGSSQPNVTVTISAKEPASFWIAGTQYDIDANTSAGVTTNGMGKITINTLAFHLHTAELTFQTDGLADPVSVYPPQNIQTRLAGVDVPTLQTATSQTQGWSQGQPPVTTPLVASTNYNNLPIAVSAIQNTFTIKSNAKINGGTIGRSRTGKPRGRVTGPHAGDFWSDLANFPEDVYHGIRTAALLLQDVQVDIDQQEISLALYLEGVGNQTLTFFIETIHDVANAVQAGFNFVETEIQAVIDWLKLLFDWTDVKNTHDVMAYFLNSFLTNVSNNLDQNSSNNLQQLITKLANTLQNQTDTVFTKLEAHFGQNGTHTPNASFSQLVQGQPYNSTIGSSPMQADVLQSTNRANAVQCNYVHSKAQTYASNGGTFLNTSGANTSGNRQAIQDVAGDLAALVSIVQNQLEPQLLTVMNTVQAKLTNDLQSNPNGVFDQGICIFLDVFQGILDLVIGAVEDVINALVTVAGGALSLLQEALVYKIEVPVISWLYQQISGNPLTLLDLLSLLIALPTTLLYKIVFGAGHPPFTAAQVQQITSDPIPWPQVNGTKIDRWAHPTRDALSGNLGVPLFPFSIELFVLSFASYAFLDACNDSLAAAGTEGTDPNVIFLSVAGIFLTLCCQAWGAPYSLFAEDSGEWSTADGWYVVLWAVGFLPWLADIAFCVVGAKHALARYNDLAPMLIFFFGMISLVVGIATMLEQIEDPNQEYNALYWVQEMVAPWPTLFKLMLPFIQGKPIPTAVLMAIDVVGDLATGALSVAESLVPGERSARRLIGAGQEALAT
jgi:hypothetical protein